MRSIIFAIIFCGVAKRDIMISDYEQGGLRMIDVRLCARALKSAWIKKNLDTDNHAKWKLFFDLQLRDIGGAAFFRSNLNKKDLLNVVKVSDAFLEDILQSWSEITFENDVTSVAQLRSQSLWFNSLVRVENKPIRYKLWASKRIHFISDLMADESTFLSFSEFKDRYSIKPTFCLFLALSQP